MVQARRLYLIYFIRMLTIINKFSIMYWAKVQLLQTI